MRMLVLAILISVASVQTQANAGKLSNRAHKYFANTIVALATLCLSCSQPQAPQSSTESHSLTSIQHYNTHTMPIELINYEQPTIELNIPILNGERNGDLVYLLSGMQISARDTQDTHMMANYIVDNLTIVSNIPNTEDTYVITIDNEVPIILTFDDGPDTRKGNVNGTRHVLDVLEDFDFNAVFFIQTHARSKSGKYYRAMDKDVGQPLVERMHDEQHIVATHTGMDAWGAHAMAHNHVRREAAGKLGKDLERSKAFIYEVTGTYPKFVRPPFGVQNKAVRQRYAKHDLKMILWDIDSRDTTRGYDRTDIEKHLQSKVQSLATAGNELVILFHDIDPDTHDTGNFIAYIKVIEQAIAANNLAANFKLSRQEIEDILLD